MLNNFNEELQRFGEKKLKHELNFKDIFLKNVDSMLSAYYSEASPAFITGLQEDSDLLA